MNKRRGGEEETGDVRGGCEVEGLESCCEGGAKENGEEDGRRRVRGGR